MDTREFTRESKILLTDIDAGRDKAAGLKKYTEMLSSAFSSYGIMKLVLNYFTRWEEQLEDPEENTAEEELFSEALTCLSADKMENDEALASVTAKVRGLRDQITEEMECLTAYTDFFSLHEYILNRKEIALFGEPEAVDTEKLAGELEQFVFSDQDKMVVNTRIQQVLEQLPVRMTKQRFYDILSETLALYKGGELSAAEDFLQSVRDVAGLTEKTQDDHPELKKAKERLEAVDYKTITKEQTEELQGLIREVAASIDAEVTDRMQLQEICNDLLMVLLMKPYRKEEYLDDRYPEAERLLMGMVSGDDAFSTAEEVLPALEGAQEDIYESLLHVEMRLEDLAGTLEKELPGEKADAEKLVRDLRMADLLTSNSLFINLEQMLELRKKDRIMADEESIGKLKEALFADFDNKFSGLDKERKRGIMARVLGHVPVFFNTREEIVEYFRYTLERCGDPGELAAVNQLLKMIIEDK